MYSDQFDLNRKISVILADDHPMMRDSLRMHLESDPNIEVVAEVGDGEEAVKLAVELTPDVIVMDITMPKLNGLEATIQIKYKRPDIAVLVLTVHNDTEHILKILEAGAAGYLTKDIVGEKLVHAIYLALSGESVLSDDVMRSLLRHALRYPLTPSVPILGEKLSTREIEVLRLAAKGNNNKQISEQLDINLRTVKGHFVNIFSKLNVSSRTQAVIVGLRIGLITMNDTK